MERETNMHFDNKEKKEYATPYTDSPLFPAPGVKVFSAAYFF